MLLESQFKRQHGSAWDSVPTIDGSRWGFIGAMAAIAVVVIIALIVCVCVCRRRGVNKRMRHSAVGSDLNTLHPTPSFGRSRKPGRQRTEDDEEADAFVASSPRQSLSYAGPVADERYTSYNDGMRLNEMNNNRYYRGSEGFQQGYQAYGEDQSQFAEPEWQQMQHPAMGSDAYGHPIGAASYDSALYSHPSIPQAVAAPYPPSGRSMGPRTHPSAPNSTTDNSLQAAYPASTYPQQAYPQEAYSQDERYEQSYQQHAPPAYPESSASHTHDMPKERMGPAAV